MTYATAAPFAFYTDRTGNALDQGYLYFGVENENPEIAPTTVYWDAAGTIPALQPIRTVNGYAWRNGQPENIYIPGFFSITVRDSDLTLVYSTLSSDLNELAAQLESSSGSSLVGYTNSGTDAVTTTVQTRLRREVWLDDYDSITHAESALSSDGGTILVGEGTYDIGAWSPTKHNVTLSGQGMEATILTGAIDIIDKSRGRIQNLTLNGNGAHSYPLGFCAASGSSATLWVIDHVMMYGGTDYSVVVGNGSNNPDTASITFRDCGAMGGAFGSSNPSAAQVLVAGSNTLLIQWIGGVIGGGQIGKNLLLANGDFTGRCIQYINSTSYCVEVSNGQFRDYDSHSEGTGGFLHWLGTDVQPLGSGQCLLQNGQYVNTGANTAGVSVLHEAARQLAIIGSFFNADVSMTNNSGRILGLGTTFGTNAYASRTGKYTKTGGIILGDSINSSMGYGTCTALSASDVQGPLEAGAEFVVRDVSNGGTAVVSFESGQTPTIVSTSGVTAFVTSSPSSGQIQVKTGGANGGVLFRADSSTNNAHLQWRVLTADEANV